MRPLVALDWGTSSLRAALIDAGGRVLQERSMPQGILSVPAGGFPAVFQDVCGDWMRASGALALICGMAGSRQGWVEAPYCPCPAGFDDVASRVAWVEPGRIAMVPGLSCEDRGVPDVLRGEETQVFGALSLLGIASGSGSVVLPGTHSKWVRVADGRIESFSTFMTGEIYALLRQHSILARTLPPADGELQHEAFQRGVEHARQSGSLLHAAFSARTLALFDRLPPAVLPSYLSGLVIGEELRAQAFRDLSGPVVVVGSQALTERYELALQGIGVPVLRVGPEAAWRGLWAIARTLEGVEAR